MRRRLLGNRRGGGSQTDTTDFEIDTEASFLIRRESDNVERLFPYSEVIDGTYNTWLNGSLGAVKQWIKGDNVLAQNNAAFQPRLRANAGSPYVDDYSPNHNLWTNYASDLTQDWIITSVQDNVQNTNNQSLSFGARSGDSLIGVMFSNSNIYVVIDRLTGITGLADYRITMTNTTAFKLYTFSRIGGVFKAEINDLEIAPSAQNNWYIQTDRLLENVMILGNSEPTYSGGKYAKYKHFKVLTGNLSNLDLNAYNQAIMTKYGL